MTPAVEVVIKVGGGLLRLDGALDRVSEGIAGAWPAPAVVVPGGGPFADAVRSVGERVALDDATAHWMALLAMDQYAHLLAARIRGAALVRDGASVASALRHDALPVLAPYRWLREADPLPHSWEVTSDSIAAWIAGALGARRLVLVKPVGAGAGGVDALTDRWFRRALPAGVEVVVVGADAPPEALRRELGGALTSRAPR
ncbi:MAG TPA: hypothetical protein VFS05_08900 [Gemmatimonadaceae bacterium]|nr:hypothetical protein [Gemmatimonadaceae bacterium]